MEKSKIIVLVILCPLLLVFCACCATFAIDEIWGELPGRTNDAQIVLDESVKYSEEELMAAVECIKGSVKTFPNCDLLLVEYDEEYSDREMNNFRNGENADNGVVFKIEFETGKQESGSSWMSNHLYTNWKYYLVKTDGASSWQVVSYGF